MFHPANGTTSLCKLNKSFASGSVIGPIKSSSSKCPKGRRGMDGGMASSVGDLQKMILDIMRKNV
jgi:hypothetical protein